MRHQTDFARACCTRARATRLAPPSGATRRARSGSSSSLARRARARPTRCWSHARAAAASSGCSRADVEGARAPAAAAADEPTLAADLYDVCVDLIHDSNGAALGWAATAAGATDIEGAIASVLDFDTYVEIANVYASFQDLDRRSSSPRARTACALRPAAAAVNGDVVRRVPRALLRAAEGGGDAPAQVARPRCGATTPTCATTTCACRVGGEPRARPLGQGGARGAHVLAPQQVARALHVRARERREGSALDPLADRAHAGAALAAREARAPLAAMYHELLAQPLRHRGARACVKAARHRLHAAGPQGDEAARALRARGGVRRAAPGQVPRAARVPRDERPAPDPRAREGAQARSRRSPSSSRSTSASRALRDVRRARRARPRAVGMARMVQRNWRQHTQAAFFLLQKIAARLKQQKREHERARRRAQNADGLAHARVLRRARRDPRSTRRVQRVQRGIVGRQRARRVRDGYVRRLQRAWRAKVERERWLVLLKRVKREKALAFDADGDGTPAGAFAPRALVADALARLVAASYRAPPGARGRARGRAPRRARRRARARGRALPAARPAARAGVSRTRAPSARRARASNPPPSHASRSPRGSRPARAPRCAARARPSRRTRPCASRTRRSRARTRSWSRRSRARGRRARLELLALVGAGDESGPDGGFAHARFDGPLRALVEGAATSRTLRALVLAGCAPPAAHCSCSSARSASATLRSRSCRRREPAAHQERRPAAPSRPTPRKTRTPTSSACGAASSSATTSRRASAACATSRSRAAGSAARPPPRRRRARQPRRARVATLALAANRIGDDGARALARGARACLTLEALWLDDNRIASVGGARSCARSRRWPTAIRAPRRRAAARDDRRRSARRARRAHARVRRPQRVARAAGGAAARERARAAAAAARGNAGGRLVAPARRAARGGGGPSLVADLASGAVGRTTPTPTARRPRAARRGCGGSRSCATS